MSIPFNTTFWASYQPLFVTSNLYSYFDGSNKNSLPITGTTGTGWISISGSVNPVIATLQNDVEYDNGFQGNVYAFNANSQGLIVDKVLLPASNWTFEAWIKKWTIGTSIQGLYKTENTNPVNDLSINVENDTGLLTINPNASATYGTIGSGLTSNQPQHIVVIYDIATNAITCYINNVLQPYTQSLAGTYSINGTISYLATRGGGAGDWDGHIYKVRTYSAKLTATQVQQNFNSEKQQYGYY